MKKIIAILMVVLLLVGVAGCSKVKNSTDYRKDPIEYVKNYVVLNEGDPIGDGKVSRRTYTIEYTLDVDGEYTYREISYNDLDAGSYYALRPYEEIFLNQNWEYVVAEPDNSDDNRYFFAIDFENNTLHYFFESDHKYLDASLVLGLFAEDYESAMQDFLG